jgi:hypothetical protein
MPRSNPISDVTVTPMWTLLKNTEKEQKVNLRSMYIYFKNISILIDMHIKDNENFNFDKHTIFNKIILEDIDTNKDTDGSKIYHIQDESAFKWLFEESDNIQQSIIDGLPRFDKHKEYEDIQDLLLTTKLRYDYVDNGKTKIEESVTYIDRSSKVNNKFIKKRINILTEKCTYADILVEGSGFRILRPIEDSTRNVTVSRLLNTLQLCQSSMDIIVKIASVMYLYEKDYKVKKIGHDRDAVYEHDMWMDKDTFKNNSTSLLYGIILLLHIDLDIIHVTYEARSHMYKNVNDLYNTIQNNEHRWFNRNQNGFEYSYEWSPEESIVLDKSNVEMERSNDSDIRDVITKLVYSNPVENVKSMYKKLEKTSSSFNKYSKYSDSKRTAAITHTSRSANSYNSQFSVKNTYRSFSKFHKE